MKTSVVDGFRFFHHHGDIGPDSRDHSHIAQLTVSADVPFNPKTGNPTDIDQLQLQVWALAVEYQDKNLHEVPGIFPTYYSLARRLHEQLLLTYPTARVVLTVDQTSVEAP